jgi:hypothetical protein
VIADTLLSRLHGVKQTAPGRWLARCPAHDDKRASLSIREADDNKLLIHDFAGCSVHEVVAAVGLKLSDLFPPRADAHAIKGERRPFPATDVLRAVEQEVLIAATAASFLGNGGSLTDEDRARLLLAAQRISRAILESRLA